MHASVKSMQKGREGKRGLPLRADYERKWAELTAGF